MSSVLKLHNIIYTEDHLFLSKSLSFFFFFLKKTFNFEKFQTIRMHGEFPYYLLIISLNLLI